MIAEATPFGRYPRSGRVVGDSDWEFALVESTPMFHPNEPRLSRGFQLAVGALALLSLSALAVTAWILTDVKHEQEAFGEIMQHLPASDAVAARELAAELRLQSRLAVLLILNIVATGVALVVLVRAYVASERSLRQVKVLATDILASMDQGVITTDRDGAILSINPRGRELLNRGDDGIGLELRSLPPRHAMLAEICGEVLQHHECVRDRDYVVDQNGHVRTMRAGCSLLRNDNGQCLGTVIHIRDVTEKALIEQRLRRMERFMGLGSLAAGLHHEIKNPLSALSLHVQLLAEALSAQDTTLEIQEIFDVLRTEVKRIANVLEGFRDYASAAQLYRAPTDLAPLIKKLVRLIEPQAKQQGIQIEMSLPDGKPEPLLVDPDRFEQVLLNLAINAMDAMPQGGVLSLRLTIAPDVAEVAVGDTGSGIPEDLRDRVFDPYFTTRSRGTGMGLALCDKIIRQHDGTIDYRTGPKGTVFAVLLPRSHDE